MFATALDFGVSLNTWPWIWLIVACVFLVIEMTFVAGTFVILPFATSAFVSCILAFGGVSIGLQWAVFVFGGALLFPLFYKWARRFNDQDGAPLGVGAERLVGMTGVITAAVEAGPGPRGGRIDVGGEVWGITDSDAEFPVGADARITEVRGARVVIEPADQPVAPEPGSITDQTTTGH